MTDFRQEKSQSAEEDTEKGSHDDSGEDCGEGEEQRPQPKRRGRGKGLTGVTPTGLTARNLEILATR